MLLSSLCDVLFMKTHRSFLILVSEKKKRVSLKQLICFCLMYTVNHSWLYFPCLLATRSFRAMFSLLLSVYNFMTWFLKELTHAALFSPTLIILFVLFSSLKFKFYFIIILNIFVETDLITLEQFEKYVSV